MFRHKDYFIYDSELHDYYASLGENGREQFLKWLSEISLPSGKRNDAINYDYSTDYRDDVYRAGHCLVYLYTNELGIPFYVGKGTEDRALNISNRNESFKERFNENGTCRIFAIVSNMFDRDALDVEAMVINELLNRGWRLTNSNIPHISKEDYESLKSDYPNVLNSINDITRTGLYSLLDDRDNFGETGKVERHNKTYVRKVAN